MDRILRRGLQAMIDTTQEELGKMVKQILRGAIKPEVLAEMLKRIGGTDFSQLAAMVGRQPGFDPYKILGLDESASDEEVRKRYHDLLHKLHPDTAGVEGTGFLLQMVLAAYELIKGQRGWK